MSRNRAVLVAVVLLVSAGPSYCLRLDIDMDRDFPGIQSAIPNPGIWSTLKGRVIISDFESYVGYSIEIISQPNSNITSGITGPGDWWLDGAMAQDFSGSNRIGRMLLNASFLSQPALEPITLYTFDYTVATDGNAELFFTIDLSFGVTDDRFRVMELDEPGVSLGTGRLLAEPTYTPTKTATPTSTNTPSPTVTHTSTSTPTVTPTPTNTPTSTHTPTPTETPTPTPTIHGDFDSNGDVDPADLFNLLNLWAGAGSGKPGKSEVGDRFDHAYLIEFLHNWHRGALISQPPGPTPTGTPPILPSF